MWCRELSTQMMKELRNQTGIPEIVNSRKPPSPPCWGRWENLCCCGPGPVPSGKSWNYLLTEKPPKAGKKEGITFSFSLLSSLQPDGNQVEASRPRNLGNTRNLGTCAPRNLSCGGWGRRGCKGQTGGQPDQGPTCTGTFHWMRKCKSTWEHLFSISAALFILGGPGTLESFQNIW